MNNEKLNLNLYSLPKFTLTTKNKGKLIKVTRSFCLLMLLQFTENLEEPAVLYNQISGTVGGIFKYIFNPRGR